MQDNIIKIDSREQYLQDMQRYSIYTLVDRYIPSITDGLKPVQRRILTAMYFDVGCTTKPSKAKSAKVTGAVIGKYHPHGDVAVYTAIKPMINWFETPIPLVGKQGNFGTFQGDPAAAARYTEVFMSKFGNECVIGDLSESKQVVDWSPTYDNKDLEPETLAVKVPLLLLNGTFSIAVGTKVEIPHHSLNDIIDATLTLLHNPKAKIALIPDPCMPCEIIDTNWQSIANKGFGYYVVRGIVKTIHNNKTGCDELSIVSVPDLVFSDTIKNKIEDLIKENKLIQVHDIQDHSTTAQLDLRIVLKHGADPEYVKQVLYKNTPLQDTKRINMEVLNGIDVSRISYKAYLLYFLEFRRNIKFRLYNFRLQKAETRLHQIDTYIKILESGDVENIIHMIRNQNSMDEGYLIEWLMKKLKITDVQAKFILHTEIAKLSKGSLNKYKEEQKNLNNSTKHFMGMILNEKLIDAEIEQELIDIRAKYGAPRKSILINESQANDIPAGEFKVVITEANYLKKLPINEPIKSIKGDEPKCIIIADNTKDILIFDEMGKVFRLPVHKIMFTDKNSPGIDIRLLIKNLTSNIRSIIYLPLVEALANKTSKYYLITVTLNGMIKRMDLNDVINATPSGIIYSKLNKGDSVRDIIIANHKSDVIVYSKSKALRMPIESTPYLKRATIGNKAMNTTENIDGIAVVTSDTTDIVVVTAKGRFNRFSVAGLPVSDRAKAGSRVIKLTRGDYISNIFSCNSHNKIRVVRADQVLEINITDIPTGSSISAGTKMCKEGIIKCELIRV